MVVTNFETFWMDISSPILRAATPPTNIASAEQVGKGIVYSNMTLTFFSIEGVESGAV